jgi:basic membrane protein A
MRLGEKEMSNRTAIYAIVVIAIIGVAGFGVYLMIQPVHNPYEVAIVFATGGLGDKSFNDGCFEGATDAYNDYGINFTYSEPTAISDYETFLRQYASHAGYIEGFDLIISIGFDQADAVMAVAEDYPEQKMAIVDMYIDPVNYTNVASLLFSANEGSALVGAIAGLMTETDHIGFLGGMDIPLIREFAAGYVFGANYTNEGITHTEQYVGDWADIPLGKSLTSGMYTGGADIIFAAAGRSGLGAYEAAKEDNVTSSTPLWVIGVDSPQMYLGCADTENPAPPTLGLTSMLKRVDVAVKSIMYEAVIGSWVGGVQIFNLSNGGVGYEINTDLLTLPTSVVDQVEAFKAEIIAGNVTIPTDVYWT